MSSYNWYSIPPYLRVLDALHQNPASFILAAIGLMYLSLMLRPLFIAFYRDADYRDAILIALVWLIVPVLLLNPSTRQIYPVLYDFSAAAGPVVYYIEFIGAGFLLYCYFRPLLSRTPEIRILKLWFLSSFMGIAATAYAVVDADSAGAIRRDAQIGLVWNELAHAPRWVVFQGLTQFCLHALFWMFLLAWAGPLYEKWFEGKLSAGERQSGRAGVRAWLAPSRLILCAAIAASASLGYASPVVIAFLLAVLMQGAYPLLRMLTAETESPEAAPAPDESLANQRERILKLLEDNKITAHECQELMQALGETAARDAAAARPRLSGARRFQLIGAGLIAFGFFLPWFSVDLAQELDRSMGRIEAFTQAPGLQSVFGGNVPQIDGRFPQEAMKGLRRSAVGAGTIQIKAGDLPYAAGWLILLLGLGAIALPWVFPELERRLRQRIEILLLAAGALATLYEMVNAFRYLSIGPFATLAGFAIASAVVVRESGVLVGGETSVPVQPANRTT